MALPVRIARGQQQFDPFSLLRPDLPLILDRFFGVGPERMDREIAPYGVDIREDNDHVYVEADVPGFRKEDIDISIENGMLSIRAEKRQEPSEAPKGDYLLRERRYERFERSFTLPSNVDAQNVNAKLEGGCLIITLDKTSESKAKKVPIA